MSVYSWYYLNQVPNKVHKAWLCLFLCLGSTSRLLNNSSSCFFFFSFFTCSLLVEENRSLVFRISYILVLADYIPGGVIYRVPFNSWIFCERAGRPRGLIRFMFSFVARPLDYWYNVFLLESHQKAHDIWLSFFVITDQWVQMLSADLSIINSPTTLCLLVLAAFVHYYLDSLFH